MNLQNFSDTIDRIIRQRGLEYYRDGAVDSLEYLKGRWTAKVIGTQEYTVRIKISDAGKITQSDCTCPYDHSMCKHQVAVLYALRDRLEGKPLPSDTPRQRLKEILTKTNKDDIIAFLLNYAIQNPEFRDDLVFRFSENPNVIEYARKLIKTSIKNAMGNYGYIEYGAVRKAVSGANKALDLMRNMTQEDQAPSRIELGILIVREMMELENHCDDSGTHVGGIIARTITLFQKTAAELPQDHPNTERVFELLLSHAFEPIYKNWSDWQSEVIKACVLLCHIPQQRRKLEDRLRAMKDDNAGYTIDEVERI